MTEAVEPKAESLDHQKNGQKHRERKGHTPKEQIPLHVRLARIETRLEATEREQRVLNENMDDLIVQCEDHLNNTVRTNQVLKEAVLESAVIIEDMKEAITSTVMSELEVIAHEAMADIPAQPEVAATSEPWYKDKKKAGAAAGVAIVTVAIGGVAYSRAKKKKEREKFPF